MCSENLSRLPISREGDSELAVGPFIEAGELREIHAWLCSAAGSSSAAEVLSGLLRTGLLELSRADQETMTGYCSGCHSVFMLSYGRTETRLPELELKLDHARTSVSSLFQGS